MCIPMKKETKQQGVKVVPKKETKRETWVGFRPSMIENKRKNNKKNRKTAKQNTKALCIQYNNT